MRRVTLVLVVVATTVGIVIGALYGGMEGADILWPITWVMWAPAGALILMKRPGNGVGVTMLTVGVLWGVSFACLAVAAGDFPLEVRVWAELVNVISGVAPWLAIIWMVLVFPKGTLDGRLQRLTAVGLIVLAVFATFAFVVTTVPMETTGQPSPFATPLLEEATEWFVAESGFLLVLVLLGVAVVSLAQRWRSSRGPERHQYRWLLLGGMFFGVNLVVAQFVPEDSPALAIWLLAGSAIPMSVGVAVSRYRLFEIDRIISRTVSYTILVALLGALFAAAVVGLPNWIPGLDDSPLLVAVGTLAVAALFNPLRKQLQSLVDSRFNRSRYDAERVMDEFAGRLREEIDTAGIVSGWTRVVSQTMQPASISVWTRS